MFDVDLPSTCAITALGGVELVDAMLATSKLDSAVQARRRRPGTSTPPSPQAACTSVLSTPTGDPAIATRPLPHPMRSVMMPRRQRPRTEETARRHAAERERNAERRLTVGRLAHDRWRAKARWAYSPDGEPPPF